MSMTQDDVRETVAAIKAAVAADDEALVYQLVPPLAAAEGYSGLEQFVSPEGGLYGKKYSEWTPGQKGLWRAAEFLHQKQKKRSALREELMPVFHKFFHEEFEGDPEKYGQFLDWLDKKRGNMTLEAFFGDLDTNLQ
jgi:hypothetical protein